jgi:hypothetical protein
LKQQITAEERKTIKEVHEEVEEEEDGHLYHTKGWSRELRLESLGLPAVVPPPEEEKLVKTAIGAERAKQSRRDEVGGRGKWGNFIAQWVLTWLLFGLYNKVTEA